jgi:opacity protein-like surface antigen
MQKQRASFGRRLAIAVMLVVAATHATASVAEPLQEILSQFDWAGTYDLVGTGFPDGERRAVMTIARADTSYALASLQGQPGRSSPSRSPGIRRT